MSLIDSPPASHRGDHQSLCVFLVESDPARADLICDFLHRDRISVVRETGGRAAYLRLASYAPDLVIIEANASGLCARDFCLRLRADGNLIPIIVTAPRYHLLDHIAALGYGADDYIDTDTPLILLYARLKVLLRRTTNSPLLLEASGGRLRLGRLQLDRHALEIRLDNRSATLTLKEFKCLWVLASQAGTVVTRDDIRNASSTGAGTGNDPNGRSIDVQVSRLKAKINRLDPNFNCIRSVRSRGYMFIVSNIDAPTPPDPRPPGSTAAPAFETR